MKFTHFGKAEPSFEGLRWSILQQEDSYINFKILNKQIWVYYIGLKPEVIWDMFVNKIDYQDCHFSES